MPKAIHAEGAIHAARQFMATPIHAARQFMATPIHDVSQFMPQGNSWQSQFMPKAIHSASPLRRGFIKRESKKRAIHFHRIALSLYAIRYVFFHALAVQALLSWEPLRHGYAVPPLLSGEAVTKEPFILLFCKTDAEYVKLLLINKCGAVFTLILFQTIIFISLYRKQSKR